MGTVFLSKKSSKNFPHGLSGKTLTIRADRHRRHRSVHLNGDPDQAERFGRLLIHHTRNLGQFPARGRIVPEFKDEAIREIIVRVYRVIYRVDHAQQSIEIIRFWHAGRGIPKLIM
jgi:toxin ParE1/3/4